MAKWEQKTLAESGVIKAVGEQATAAINNVNSVLSLISDGASVAKKFLSAFANPLATALVALADEIIKALNDYKELGFFVLVVNPFDENYGAKVQGERFGYGLMVCASLDLLRSFPPVMPRLNILSSERLNMPRPGQG